MKRTESFFILGFAATAHFLTPAYAKADELPAHISAAELRGAEAQLKLSEAYHLGRGISQDYLLAGWWLMKVLDKRAETAKARRREWRSMATKGDLDAQEQLNKIARSINTLIEQAERGSAHAQNRLAFAYSLDQDVPRNDVAAVAWYRRSAEQGNARGQTFLAMSFTLKQMTLKQIQRSQ